MAPTLQAPPMKMPQLNSNMHDRRPDTASGSSAIIDQGIFFFITNTVEIITLCRLKMEKYNELPGCQ